MWVFIILFFYFDTKALGCAVFCYKLKCTRNLIASIHANVIVDRVFTSLCPHITYKPIFKTKQQQNDTLLSLVSLTHINLYSFKIEW